MTAIIDNNLECLRPGSHSFDVQYLSLLKAIAMEGEIQTNKKGPNRTLRRSYTLTIDVSDVDHDRYLLPMTTLRSLYGGRQAVHEAIWYLRGEDNVKFLQKHGCRFWDKQCDENGWLGLNYGLLTSFPQPGKICPVNQLESEVLSRLCNGKQSRNMICTLVKPGEPTEQVACTSSIQFSVSVNKAGKEALDLTVNQRSSDVIVGLPHDVVVWTILLHLVRREVLIRTKGKHNLAAGNLVFMIAAGGAHVYDLNVKEFEELRTREPILGSQPYLTIQGEDGNTTCLAEQVQHLGMFSLAKDYDPQLFRIISYTKFHRAIRVHQAV
jgi:thymidylate synthase